MKKNTRIVVFTVATNIYFDYWVEMVNSANRFTSPQDLVKFVVFTDAPDVELKKIKSELTNIEIECVPTQNLVWPAATLMRYSLMNSMLPNMDCEIAMHLDADMLFVKSPWNLISQFSRSQISLVSHPGYFRPKGSRRVRLYFQSPKILMTDLKLILQRQAIGAWETNRKSKAFVPRNKRLNYVCGATWFGPKHKILSLLQVLMEYVDFDLKHGVSATWNDESYLNQWASCNSFRLIDPRLCFEETAIQLGEIPALIVAREKLTKTR